MFLSIYVVQKQLRGLVAAPPITYRLKGKLREFLGENSIRT